MLHFSHPAEKPKQRRVARRELVIGGIGGRFSMVQRRAGSIRTQYHNVAVELPPPPSVQASQHATVTTEHSYAKSQQ